MPKPWEFAQTASIMVNAPAAVSFDFMADGMKQTRWALGSWDRRQVSDDIFVGKSLFNNNDLYVRLVSDRELRLIDYYCGVEPGRLLHSVEARIIDGETLGLGKENSVVTMTIWREANISDDEWALTEHVWHTEIHLIKGCIEREYVGR